MAKEPLLTMHPSELSGLLLALLSQQLTTKDTKIILALPEITAGVLGVFPIFDGKTHTLFHDIDETTNICTISWEPMPEGDGTTLSEIRKYSESKDHNEHLN